MIFWLLPSVIKKGVNLEVEWFTYQLSQVGIPNVYSVIPYLSQYLSQLRPYLIAAITDINYFTILI